MVCVFEETDEDMQVMFIMRREGLCEMQINSINK